MAFLTEGISIYDAKALWRMPVVPQWRGEIWSSSARCNHDEDQRQLAAYLGNHSKAENKENFAHSSHSGLGGAVHQFLRLHLHHTLADLDLPNSL